MSDKEENVESAATSETKKEDIPDPTEVSDSETEDDEELESPRECARVVRCADPTMFRESSL